MNFNVKTLKLTRVADPITFTDEKAAITRTMTAITNPTKCFLNVLTAMNQVFPGCTNFKYKLINSLANDPPQRLHTDFDTTHLIFKKITNLDSFHYSAIIALQPNASPIPPIAPGTSTRRSIRSPTPPIAPSTSTLRVVQCK